MSWNPPEARVIPIRTIVRVILAIATIWLLIELRHVVLLIVAAFILAAALAPLVHRLEERGWPLPAAVAVVLAALVGVIALVVWFLVPRMVSDGESLVEHMPEYIDRAQVVLRRYPAINERMQGYFEPSAEGAGADVPVSQVVALGTAVVSRLLDTFLVIVMAIYLLVDGERISRVFMPYLSPVQRSKTLRLMPEVVNVVSGYVVGQAITSLLFGMFAFGALTMLGVPQPMLLAVLAGVMDAVPIFGVPVATIPAVLAGLTVSVPTAVGVLALYVAYQQVENYLLVPRIYGRTLHVSPFGILVGVLIGGELLGVIGILLALPITAAIPIVMRIWREEETEPAGPPAQLALSPRLPARDDQART